MKRFPSLTAITATILLLGVVGSAQAELRVGPNYRLDSDTSPFRGRDLVGLAVNPSDPQHVVEVNANYLDLRCEVSVSNDGGDSWSTAVPLVPPALGAGEAWTPGCGFHGSVQFGSGQNVYAVATVSKTTPSIPDAAVVVFRSTNGGATWQTGVVALAEGAGSVDSNVASQGPSYTRPAVAVDAGGVSGGGDRVYAVARDIVGKDNAVGGCTPALAPLPPVSCPNPMRVAFSNDSGQTFSTVANASPLGVNTTDPGPAVVNTDGSVSVAWRTLGRVGTLQATRSTDQGQTWSAPANIATVTNTGTGVPTHTPPAPPATTGASSTAASPRLTIDPNTPGRIYIVYSQSPPDPPGFAAADHFVSPDSRVYFQRSSDFGATWSAPKRISDATSLPGARTHQTRHPNVSVSPSGRVNIVWHDRRHWLQGPAEFDLITAAGRTAAERNCTHSHIFCEDIRLGDTYYSYSDNGGLDFSENIRVNDRSHNNEVGYDTRPAAYWWSGPQTVTVGGGRQLIAWLDSREGNWDTDTEDVYLATVDFNATGTAPRTHVDQPDAVARSVALSKIAYQGGNEGALVGGARDPLNAGLASAPTGPASRNASSVVIVDSNDVAGAIAATVLARANPGPVLLSSGSSLPASVAAEITRMRPSQAFLIGSTAGLITDVMAAGDLLMSQVTSISGADSAATAALIAARMDYRTQAEKDANLAAFDGVVIANPATPEAASAVALAAARRLPILYVSTNDTPAATTNALAELDIDTTLVIGGTTAVSSAVLSGLPGATRLGGADAYATSQSVVTESTLRGLPSNVVYVADGAQPMDATLLSGVVARATGMLVLAAAPLYSTATQQAANFGLTGIAKYVLLGPPVPVVPPPPPPPPPAAEAPPPPPPPPPPPAAPPELDSTAPAATLSGAVRQKLGPTVSVAVTCTSEPCTATVSATIRVPKVGTAKARTLKPASISAKLAKSAKRTFGLRLSATARRAILKALKARKSVSAQFTVTVVDAAGNKRTLRRTVRFRR